MASRKCLNMDCFTTKQDRSLWSPQCAGLCRRPSTTNTLKARTRSGLCLICPKRQHWRGFQRFVRKVRSCHKDHFRHKLHKNEAERALYSLFVRKAVSHAPYTNQWVAKGSLDRDLAGEGDRARDYAVSKTVNVDWGRGDSGDRPREG